MVVGSLPQLQGQVLSVTVSTQAILGSPGGGECTTYKVYKQLYKPTVYKEGSPDLSSQYSQSLGWKKLLLCPLQTLTVKTVEFTFLWASGHL